MGRVVKVQLCAAGSAPPLVERTDVEIVARYFVPGSERRDRLKRVATLHADLARHVQRPGNRSRC